MKTPSPVPEFFSQAVLSYTDCADYDNIHQVTLSAYTDSPDRIDHIFSLLIDIIDCTGLYQLTQWIVQQEDCPTIPQLLDPGEIQHYLTMDQPHDEYVYQQFSVINELDDIFEQEEWDASFDLLQIPKADYQHHSHMYLIVSNLILYLYRKLIWGEPITDPIGVITELSLQVISETVPTAGFPMTAL